MKRTSIASIALVLAATVLTGCGRYAVNEIVTIEPNETAFLIPLQGDSTKQAQTNSIEFLEKNKIQAKNVEIPHRIVQLCNRRSDECFKDVPEYRLIKVSRTPVSRQWTKEPSTGTSAKDDALHVESIESIGFYMGGSITAHISDSDAAKFQYYFAGQSLEKIVDDQVRKYILVSLSEKAGALKLDEIRAGRSKIFGEVRAEAVKHFAEMGITIDNLGYTDGMTYENKQIQQSIDKQFEASALAETAKQQARAAEEFAKAQQATTSMVELELRKKLVDAQVEMMHRSDAKMPNTLIINGGAGDGISPMLGAMIGGNNKK